MYSCGEVHIGNIVEVLRPCLLFKINLLIGWSQDSVVCIGNDSFSMTRREDVAC